MQFFYDGQIRRHVSQVIRALSSFVVRHGDGTLEQVPVTYGDIDRQVASLSLNQGSENSLTSAPKIAVYISDIELNSQMLSDASFTETRRITERKIVNGEYTTDPGLSVSIERIMPVPYMLTIKADIWATSSDQKLQILEQLLVLFNPSLEIQSSDNYVDWTSLSVLTLKNIVYSSTKSIPVGTNNPIDVATLTFETPMYINMPAKVKKMGVITNIISNVSNFQTDNSYDPITGLPLGGELTSVVSTVNNFSIQLTGNTAVILPNGSNVISWATVLKTNETTTVARLSLKQPNSTVVVGYGTIETDTDTVFTVTDWDADTFPQNTLISSDFRPSGQLGTFDAIIDPFVSKVPTPLVGARVLLLNEIGGGFTDTYLTTNFATIFDTPVDFDKVESATLTVNGVLQAYDPINNKGKFFFRSSTPVPANSTVQVKVHVNNSGAIAWKSVDNADFIADKFDLIEWDGSKWNIVFSAKEYTDTIVYHTNLATLTQYKWNGVEWTTSIDGVYPAGNWRIDV